MTRTKPAAVHRDLARIEEAHRRTLTENEQLRELLHIGGPLRSLARAYADVLIAASPLRGRSLDTSSGASEFDRPLPHEPTARLRAVQEKAERMMSNMTLALQDALGDPTERSLFVDDVCDGCGQVVDDRRRRGAVSEAREFVRKVLADGPVEAACVWRLAAQQGISPRTVDRALRGRGAPGVSKFQQHNRWWWQLEEGAS